MTRALNKYVLFIKLRWAEIMRGRGADKVTRREFIQYARQVAAEYQYLKLGCFKIGNKPVFATFVLEFLEF